MCPICGWPLQTLCERAPQGAYDPRHAEVFLLLAAAVTAHAEVRNALFIISDDLKASVLG